MKKFILFLCMFLFVAVARYTLAEFNRFSDVGELENETVIVTGKGVYYQPFRVDFLTGRSSILRQEVRIPVLAERAARTNIGDPVEIVIGRGLLLKPWISPADKHAEYNTFKFKASYLGVFVGIFAFISFVFFRSTRQLSQTKKFGMYSILVVASFIIFYAF